MPTLITVVVPVYNVESYLKKCVTSICNQTYTALEIILVDDGSTDSSGKICDNLAMADPRIKVLHKKNGGLSEARNYGIAAARGEYIAFIDSDDRIAGEYTSIYTITENKNRLKYLLHRMLNEKTIKKIKNLYTSKNNSNLLA